MMLSEALVSGTYQQYKQDTNHLIDWLSRTAITCGYDIKHLAGLVAKKHETQKYRVSAREIKAQAELIAQCTKPRILAPASVLKATKDAIQARKMCSSFYVNRRSPSKSDQGHILFISTLETVLDTLQSMQTEASGTTPPSKRTSTVLPGTPFSEFSTGTKNKEFGSQRRENKFNSLKVEESDAKYNEWTSHLNPVRQARPVPVISTPVTFEVETSEDDEKQFELLCFFKDLCEVRSHLKVIWNQYKNGELSLVVASILSNIAIGSIKDMEADLAETHGFSDLECNVYVFNDFFSYDDDGKVIAQAHGDKTISSEDFQDFKDVVGTLCNFILQYQQERRDMEGELEEEDVTDPIVVVPIYSMTLSELLLSRSAKVAAEHKKLSRLLMESAGVLSFYFETLQKFPKYTIAGDIWKQDMVSQGIIAIMETGRISIWTTLACRFYLDAQSILGENHKDPYKELLSQASLLSADLNTKTPGDNLKGWMGCSKCTKCGSAELRRSEYHIDILIDKSPYVGFKQSMLFVFGPKYIFSENQNNRIWAQRSPSVFFEQNMLYCGNVALSLLLDREVIGIDFEKHYAAIQTVAHLYHVSRFLEHVEILPIPELDNFIQKQGYLLFGTAIPKTFKAAYDCFLRSTGASTATKRREQRKKGKTTFQAGPSKTIRRNRTFDFLRQYCHGEASIRSAVYNLMTQNGLESPTIHSSSGGKSNLVSVLQTLSQQLSTQLPEINKANYWVLANKCVWALTLIRAKLNHEYGNGYSSSIKYTEQAQAIVRWFPMVANILQGAGEAETGESLAGVAAADVDVGECPTCHCCGLAQLRTALDVLGKVWAFKDKVEGGKRGAGKECCL